MQTKGRDLQGFVVVLLALGAGAFLLLRNLQPAVSYTIPGPTVTPTPQDSTWEQVIQNQLVNGSTAYPTHQIPLASYEPPTLPPIVGTAVLVQPTQIFQIITPTVTRAAPLKETLPGPTAGPGPDSQLTVVAHNNPNTGQFSPPPEIVPLSMDPRDHFYFKRPVDSSANSSSLQYYPFGSDGPQNTWRIHHGIDMPNPTGKEVRAAGPGHVIWASDHYIWMENGRVTDEAYSYGNVVIIQHDFGYDGQPLFTLYAHLAVILVHMNQVVDTGTIVGLSGATGQVSGPHVHFEVRMERNHYCNTFNPILWMAPYLDHGIVAGRINYRDGSAVQDATVSLLQNGRVNDTTTTYVYPTGPGSFKCNVRSDTSWNENFVFGDVPVGTYQVMVNVNGLQLSRDITVRPATTTFIDLGQAPSEPLTPFAKTTATLAP